MKFVNEAKPLPPEHRSNWPDHPGAYGFDHPSPLLYVWSRLLQSTISQAGTYILTGKFHDSHTGIFKCEGGCNIVGVGELVLREQHCSWDFVGHSGHNPALQKMRDLINHIVLNWYPIDPVNSILATAAQEIMKSPNNFPDEVEAVKALAKAVEKTGGPFNGDALSSFFDYNPFSKFPVNRDYLRYCKVKINGETNADADQQFADEDLGDDLLKRMLESLNKVYGKSMYYPRPMCCRAKRWPDKGLQFWVNTGSSTQIDGWRTQEELEKFISSGQQLTKENS